MEHTGVEAAYGPFVAALREDGFVAPHEGWPAELVAAHVCCNNDLVSEAVERIVAGERASYDNTEVVDETRLGSYADRAGGLAGLADAVEASARRLGEASASMNDATGAQMLPCVIVDSGAVVRKGPIAIRDLIEINVTRHLEMHLRQLEALRP
jgi:hypothetical protein